MGNYIKQLPNNGWPNFALGSKDRHRAASRANADMVDGMNMLLFLLPGTPFTYYGEEIGMEDNTGPDIDLPQATPMQWNNASQAGFSNNTGNLLVKENYAKINVARQKAGKVRSHYNNYRELAKLRHQEAILFGSTRIFTMKNNTVFGLTRVKRGNPGYLLLINLDDKSTEVDLVPEEGEKVKNVPSKVRMYIKSVGEEGVEKVPESETKSFSASQTPLLARQVIVFTFVPNF